SFWQGTNSLPNAVRAFACRCPVFHPRMLLQSLWRYQGASHSAPGLRTNDINCFTMRHSYQPRFHIGVIIQARPRLQCREEGLRPCIVGISRSTENRAAYAQHGVGMLRDSDFEGNLHSNLLSFNSWLKIAGLRKPQRVLLAQARNACGL